MDKNENDIFLKIKATLLDFLTLNNKSIQVDANLINENTDIVEAFGIDSIELLDLIASIERSFSIRLEATEFVGKTKIIDVISIVKKYQDKKA